MIMDFNSENGLGRTSGAATPAPESTENRPSPQPGEKKPDETSSVTEDDNESEEDSDSRDAQYRCSHCFTTSMFLFYNVLRSCSNLPKNFQVPKIGNLEEKINKSCAGTVGLIGEKPTSYRHSQLRLLPLIRLLQVIQDSLL